jgi:hypothetical protein
MTDTRWLYDFFVKVLCLRTAYNYVRNRNNQPAIVLPLGSFK